MGARGGSELDRGEIGVAGVLRSYWLARAPRQPGQPAPPLLIALHGSGMDERGMAWFTGLAKRGPAAGITTVFPDGWKGGCHPVTLYRIDGGGHGWPGGPQFMPARAIGKVAKHLDATGLLLDMAGRETAIALGHHVFDWGEIA